MGAVQGVVAPGFEPAKDAFEAQFAGGAHIGAAVAAYHHGRKVVDLWGGLADADTGKPWTEDTLAICFSTTKGLTAACLHLLAERGLVRYDDLVTKYWPEFGANGKSAITVYHLLTHQAGIPQLPDGIVLDDLCDWERMIRGMEELSPVWEPGTATGYHAVNFGFLVGEVVRRIDGRSVGTFFRDEIAAPLRITELHIGLPAALDERVATLQSMIQVTPEMEAQRSVFVTSLSGRALGATLGGDMNELFNTPAGRSAEIPALNGAMSARDLARMYACYAGYGELDGTRLYSEQTVRTLSKEQTHRPDKVLVLPIRWSMGYMNGGDPGWPQGPRASSFGHPGFGGSLGYADPEIGLSFGVVMNGLNFDLFGAGRTATLAHTIRACAESAR